MTKLRLKFQGPLLGPSLTLTFLWVSLAMPALDREVAGQDLVVVSDGGKPLPSFSHDHRLCLLLQSSPGWIAPGAPQTGGPQSFKEATLGAQAIWESLNCPRGPSARAPPQLP